jgi:hypothetical protein
MRRLFALLSLSLCCLTALSANLPAAPKTPDEEDAYYFVQDVVGKKTRMERITRTGENGVIQHNDQVVAMYTLSVDGKTRRLTAPRALLEIVMSFPVSIFALPHGASVTGETFLRSMLGGEKQNVNKVTVSVSRRAGEITFTFTEREGNETNIGTYTYTPGSLLPERYELKKIIGTGVVMHVLQEKRLAKPPREADEENVGDDEKRK